MDNNLLKREAEQLVLAIKEEQIIVAPEGKAEIHVTVINESPNEDYIDIQVKGIPADWITMDTPAIHLAPGEAKQVILTVQPPAVPQSRVGEYPLDVHAISQSNPKRLVIVRTILIVAAYESKGRIGVLLDSIYFSISPGSSIDIPIVLQNRGQEGDSFRLDVEGLPATWISTNSLMTALDPSASQEVILTINAPRSSEASAGRTPFVIQVISQNFPDQKTEVECILAIAAFTHFSALLELSRLRGGQFGQVVINNEGNIRDTYSLSFKSLANVLIFEKAVEVPNAGSQPGTQQQVEIAYVEIPPGERFQVDAGQSGAYPFRSRLRARPILGWDGAYPFTVTALSAEHKALELSGQVIEGGLIPFWWVPTILVGFLICFLLFFITFRSVQISAHATQAASISQTQSALLGPGNPDNEGIVPPNPAIATAAGSQPVQAVPVLPTVTPIPTSTPTLTMTPSPTLTVTP